MAASGDDPPARFRTAVHRHMQARAWSVGQLAAAAGMEEQRLRRLLLSRDVPTVDELARIGAALGVDPSELLAAPGKP